MGTGKTGKTGQTSGMRTSRLLLAATVLTVLFLTGPGPFLAVAFAESPWQKVTGGIAPAMDGVKVATISMAAGGFATGIALRSVPVLSRKIRENGLEWVEQAAITAGVIGLGGAVLTFANEIGRSLGGDQGSSIENPNPWDWGGR